MHKYTKETETKDPLGDLMKMYEGIETGRCFIPLTPIMARMDGRSFHSFTKGLTRPYDERLCQAMVNTTKILVEETCACMGYTQSDEITLVWHSTSIQSQLWFNGKIQKMVSQLGALTTLYFYREIARLIPEKLDQLPSFDARVWQLPTRKEATKAFLWREKDATKNSVTMAASCYYSPKELYKKTSNERQELLFQKGVNWNDYPAFFKRGSYIQRRKVTKRFSREELEKLPPKHEARINPELKIERAETQTLVVPPFYSLINKEEVIFLGADPKIKDDQNNF